MNLIEIGIILKPQGIKGEIKIQPKTDDISRFNKLSYIILDGAEKKVIKVRTIDRAAFLLIEGISDRNEAEKLRGKSIFVYRKDSVKSSDRYFIDDVVGCSVLGENCCYGKVIEIMKNKLNRDVYVIENNGKKILFPFISSLVVSVDIENKIIKVDDNIFKEVSVNEV